MKKENYDFKKLSPFKWFCLTNFPFIEYDFDALTNYELMCKIVQYLNDVIVKTNEIGEQTENLTNAFIELKNYVDNYFENLDVQEEINNKLDEMAESGQLQEIIEQFLQTNTPLIFENVDAMKDATNLIDGTYAQTLGYYEINDGGSSLYVITDDDTLSVDDAFVIELDNGLKAKLIHTDYVEVEKLGFKSDNTFDCGSHFEYIMAHNNTINHTINLLFGNKTYYFSETLIYSNLYFNIYGKSNNLGNYERHTIFKPYQANQRFILKIGGTKEFTTPESWLTYWKTNFIIEGITFSDDNYPLLQPSSPNAEKYGLLCIEYFSGLILDINFTNTTSRCIYIKNCWEIHFKNLSCRACYYPVTSSAIYIDDVLDDGSSNTSAFFFDFIDIESINGTFLRTGNLCKIINWIIDKVSIENGNRAPEGTLGHQIAIIEDETTYNTCTPFGLFEFNSYLHGVQFNEINLHNFGNKYFYIDNNNTKGVDTLMKLRSNYEININAINFNGCGAFQQIFGDSTLDTYIESILTISQMTYSPRTLPQTSPNTSNGDMLGYFYNKVTGGIINVNQTNMTLKNSSVYLLKPKLYENLSLKNEIAINNYGRLRFGKTDNAQSGILENYISSTLSKDLYINYPCKIKFGLKPKELSESGEHVIGAMYYTTDNQYGGRVVQNIGSGDIDKNITRTIEITQEIVNTYNILRLTIPGVTKYQIDYIDVIPS